MLLISKINFKKFIPISLLVTTGFTLFCKNPNEFYVTIGIYLATLMNLAMLVEGIMELTKVAPIGDNNPVNANKEKVVYLFIGKVIVLILALTLGVQIIGNRIIIAIINYITQIFVLVLCLKKV